MWLRVWVMAAWSSARVCVVVCVGVVCGCAGAWVCGRVGVGVFLRALNFDFLSI